ncbi:MAG: hypothetical protein JJ892_04835 [Balneola sp.]|nr:hypothetical protein [Balneola sp.]MBO6870319.1 hypothetical protein [Balneola sp.]
MKFHNGKVCCVTQNKNTGSVIVLKPLNTLLLVLMEKTFQHSLIFSVNYKLKEIPAITK